MSSRAVRRSLVLRFVKALGYDPNTVLRVRLYPDRVEVDAVETIGDLSTDTHRHPIAPKP